MRANVKRSGFSMIELVFVIVILGVLAAVAVPRFVATRTDAQIATARSDMASAQKAVVAKVFADNIDTTASKAPDPNKKASTGGVMTWGEWIIEVAGLDGSRWGIALNTGGDKLSSAVSTKWGQAGQGWCTVEIDNDAVAPIGNVNTNKAGGNNMAKKGFCGPVLGIATGAGGKCGSGGFMIFNPSNAGQPFINSTNTGVGGDGGNTFCIGYSKSYQNSLGMGNKVVPLSTSGTLVF